MVEQEDYNYLDAYNIFSELITINKETDIMFYKVRLFFKKY